MDLVKNNRFKGNSYDTLENRRTFLNKLILGNRLGFYIPNFWIFIKSGWAGKSGKLDAEAQVKFSTQNIDVVEKCGGKIHLRNLDRLKALDNQAVVLISNHMSLLETALVHSFIRPYVDFSFVVKESLLNVPFFGHILRSMNAIGVTRKNPKDDFQKILTYGSEILKSGRSIIIFPQSTRSEVFNASEFNSIGVKLARRANVKVVPMALKTNFVKTGKLIRDMGPVDLKEEIYFDFGEPIEVVGNGKEAHSKVIEYIESRLKEWNSN